MTAIPTESREELEKLERKHAENPEGRYFVPLANAFRKAGDVEQAMRVLRTGLAKHPDYLSAHIVLGRCLVDVGALGEAESEFRQVLSLDPQNLIALRTLAEIAVAAGKTDEARTWYQDLLAVDPMNEEGRRALDALRAAPPAPPAEMVFEAAEPWAPDVPALDDPAPERAVVDAPASAPHEAAPSTPTGSGDPVPPATAAPSTEYDALFGTMLDLGPTPAAAGDVSPFGEDSAAVVTETIAELYTRQGFYDRAADVYRELIRRRGGDPALQERLRRVEALASQADIAASTAPIPPAAPVDPTATPEPGGAGGALHPAEHVEHADAWGEAAGAVDLETAAPSSAEGSFLHDDGRTPEGGGEGVAGPAGSTTIREYLRSVASWSPPAQVEAEAPTPAADPAPPPPLSGLDVIWADEPDERGGWDREGPAPAGEFDWSGGAAEPPEQTSTGSVLWDEDPLPWELPQEGAAVGGDHPPEPAAPPPVRNDTFDRSGGGTEPDPASDPAKPAPRAEAEGRELPPSASQEDDDLESFQAWLRGLKR